LQTGSFFSASRISADYLKALPGQGYSTGVSVSYFNGAIDFVALRTRRFTFAYLKATQGVGAVDPKARAYVTQARGAGLAIGLYHFFDPSGDPVQQADNFLRAARSLGATLPPVADFAPVFGRPIPSGYADRAYVFLTRMKSVLGTNPAVYTSRGFADQYLDLRFGDFPLFLADYSASARARPPHLPKWWTSLTFWDVAAGIENDQTLKDIDIITYKGDIAQAKSR
jgi:lysozyme